MRVIKSCYKFQQFAGQKARWNNEWLADVEILFIEPFTCGFFSLNRPDDYADCFSIKEPEFFLVETQKQTISQSSGSIFHQTKLEWCLLFLLLPLHLIFQCWLFLASNAKLLFIVSDSTDRPFVFRRTNKISFTFASFIMKTLSKKLMFTKNFNALTSHDTSSQMKMFPSS